MIKDLYVTKMLESEEKSNETPLKDLMDYLKYKKCDHIDFQKILLDQCIRDVTLGNLSTLH